MEFIKKYLQLIKDNNGNIELSDKLNNIISISYINIPDPKNANTRSKVPYAYLTSDGAAKQQTDTTQPASPPPSVKSSPRNDINHIIESPSSGFNSIFENKLKRFE